MWMWNTVPIFDAFYSFGFQFAYGDFGMAYFLQNEICDRGPIIKFFDLKVKTNN